MQFTAITFLWLLICLLAGTGYAWLLYGSSKHLEKNTRYGLFALRTLVITFIAFLLFAPVIRHITTTREKPLILIAQDNSASILVSKGPGFSEEKYLADLRQLESDLSADYEVRTLNFGAGLRDGLDVKFDASATDISAVFDLIDENYANRNIGALILATDGIYNRGANPVYGAKNVRSSIYTIALGDTVARRDLLIANVNYNNITYLDNQFQLEVAVEAYQAQGSTSLLTVSDRSGTVFSRPVMVRSNEFRETVPVMLQAKNKGIQQYTIRLAPISNELSVRNNTQTIFVEVIDGRQNVLILANSPHPDITALRQSIEVNKNYSVKVAMAGEEDPQDLQDAGLIILHQLPSVTKPVQDILRAGAKKPVLFVIGAHSSLNALSSAQPLLGITSNGTMQEVLGSFDADFYTFTISDQSKQRIGNFAPLLSPFGNYGLKSPVSTLLSQQVGKLVTKAPLLVFGEDADRKIGILTGEGIWRWRLEDFQENGTHESVDELVTKTVQYLAGKDDKRKFRVYASKNSFDENEHILLNAELYNDAFELVNDPDVNISLTSKAGKRYSFVFSRTTNAYTLDAGLLPPGEYSYAANTQLGKVKHNAGGQFVISQQEAEFRQTRADHQFLHLIADQSNGKMVFPAQVGQLKELIRANENIKTIAYEDKKYEEPISLKLLFFLILSLISIEWFGRKRNGEV